MCYIYTIRILSPTKSEQITNKHNTNEPQHYASKQRQMQKTTYFFISFI